MVKYGCLGSVLRKYSTYSNNKVVVICMGAVRGQVRPYEVH